MKEKLKRSLRHLCPAAHILKTALLTFVFITILLSAAVNAKADNNPYTDNGKGAYSHIYSVAVDSDGEISLTVRSNVENPWKVWKNINKYGFDGARHFINKSYEADPRAVGYLRIAELKYTNVQGGSASVILDEDIFKNAISLSQGSSTYAVMDTSEMKLNTYGSRYVTHNAYIFAVSVIYANDFADIDAKNNGLAGNVAVRDANKGSYRIYYADLTSWGSWTDCAYNCYHDITKRKSGDIIQFKTISGLGVEASNTVSYTVPYFRLKLDANGGEVFFDSYLLGYNRKDNTTVNVPVKSGYHFEGWYAADGTRVYDSDGKLINDGVYFKNDSYIEYGNLKLYARWSPWKHTVAYNANGGCKAPESQIKIYGSPLILALSVPERSGYRFCGWSILPGGSAYYTAGGLYGEDRDGGTVTLYAVWRDETAPVGSISASPAGWTNGDVKITASGSDNGSGIRSIEIFNGRGEMVAAAYGTSAAYMDGTEGIEDYSAVITDNAGNSVKVSTRDYIDKTFPASDISEVNPDGEKIYKDVPENPYQNITIGWVNRDVMLKVGANDSGSGIKSIVMYDGSGCIVASDNKGFSYSFTSEGISYYKVEISDNSGNIKTVNIKVMIDKTPPEIYDNKGKRPIYNEMGEILLESGNIDYCGADYLSGVESCMLYYEDGREAAGFSYDDKTNRIRFDTVDTYELRWLLKVWDKAGNSTAIRIHTPYNFSFRAELDNLLEMTDYFLCKTDAMLYIDTYGYVDAIEVKWDVITEGCALSEGYSLEYTKENGRTWLISEPKKEGSLNVSWKVPNSIGMRKGNAVAVTAWREGYSKTSFLFFDTITEEDYGKEISCRFKRSILSSTWEMASNEADVWHE